MEDDDLREDDGFRRRLIVLGSGTSTGVPVLGCVCPVCSSDDPRNSRTRPSVLIRLAGGDLLIDTPPELRLQLLREGIPRAHAILFTHAHADHLFGLDDARAFPKMIGGPVPIYCEAEVEDAIRQAFPYAFDERSKKIPAGGVPQIEFQRIGPAEPFWVLGEKVTPIRLHHGRFQVLGFRIADLAYCTDVSMIPEQSIPDLVGLDTLILDGLRPEPHPTHFCLDEALAAIDRLKPRRAFLTHLSHCYDHGPAEERLPDGVRLSYDGLAIDF